MSSKTSLDIDVKGGAAEKAAPSAGRDSQKKQFGFAELTRKPIFGPLIAFVLAMIVFSALNKEFLTTQNFSLILQQSVVIGILAAGQTLVILTAGIDLSVGAIAVMSTILMAKLAPGFGEIGALLITIALATAIGMVNGMLSALVKLPPFIVTLGIYSILFAATILLAGPTTYNVDSYGLLTWFGNKVVSGSSQSATYGVIALIVVYAAVSYILNQTAWGKHVISIGSNPNGSKLVGINVSGTLVGVYALTGFIAGIAAWVQLGRIPIADPNALQNANLASITAVVIGGTSLFGGRGGMFGTLLGVLIVGVLSNGHTLAGVDDLYQNIATGILVIAAVAFDQLVVRRRLS